RRSANLGNHGIVRPEFRLGNDLNGHCTAQDTFDRDQLIQTELAFRVMESCTRAHPGPRRGAIHFPFGKYTDVTAVMSRAMRRTRENRAVKEAQVRLEWMCDRQGLHDCVLDRSPGLDELKIVRGVEL